jgi:DNA repair protein RadD
VWKLAKEFGHIDLIFIDEAHLLSDKSDGMYGVFISDLKKINPNLKIIKLTATPYRMGMGMISDAKDICYDLTNYKAFNRLIAEGYLAPLVTKRTVTKIDISRVGIGAGGDFNQKALEHSIDTNDINYLACKEIVEYGQDRRAWLVFSSGIKHSERLAEMMRSFGIPTVAVHSKMGDGARDAAIEVFKGGKYRCVVNNRVLTTGFDYPAIDLIADLNPTMSTGLHVQKYGRGTRPSPETGKTNCLGLDFAGNVPRLGPINDPVIPRPKNASGTPGTPPIKICDQCGTYNHASARFCESCLWEFPIGVAITRTAGTDELLRVDMPIIEWFQVQRVVYSAFKSQAGDNYLKATYVVAGSKKPYMELLGLEKGGYAAKRARDWWKKRMNVDEAPPSVGEALKWTTELMQPRKIQVHTNKQPYPEIVAVEF